MRGNKIYALKKGVKFRHVACVLFLVVCIVLPNCMGAIDASIPYEKKGEYDRMIYDWLPDFAKPSDYSGSWYLGAHGQGFLSDYWFDGLEWLSEQDTDVPVEDRPAFIAWWDYGFQCVQDGKHPTIADNFQNGIPPAGNFITAQNETRALSVLITRILSANYMKHGKITDDVNDILLLHLGKNDSKTLKDIITDPDDYVDYVLENQDKCGERTKDIADREQNTGLHTENIMYAASMILLGERGEETVVNLLHDLQEVTGYSIRYFAADARMFPFSWSNTGIFYAPTVLSDQDVNDFFETLIIGTDEDQSVSPHSTTTTIPMTVKEFIEWRDNAPPEHIRYASDYELKYKESFYNSMFYKGYIGYSGKDIGSDGIPGLSPALAGYPPMPAWMMKHFRLVYLNAGLRILKFYEGAYVNGTIVTEGGAPVPNIYVTVLDDFGIPHDMVLTNETGYYSLVVPFGMKENKYNVTIVASSGNLNPLYKIGDKMLDKKTIHVKESEAFSRKNIMLNFTIKGASLHGKVSWDDGETVSNGSVLLKTDTKTFTENISSDGGYRFDDLAPATYKLWLNTSGHEFYVEDVALASDSDTGKDITLKGSVSGDLYYDKNANVSLSLFDETNLTRMNVTSNESYSFEKILPGNYTLTVDDDNYLNFTSSFNLGLNDEKTVNITLQSVVFVSGNTTYNTEIMKNVTLRFKGPMNATTVSNETGFYRLKLIPGNYSISSTYVDNNVVYVFNDVLEIRNLSITKNISLKKGERIYGYVCHEKYEENNTVNETLSNVHITFKSENVTVKAVSNSTGYYEVYLPSDSYTVLVSYKYNETLTLVYVQPFTLTEGKEQNITLIEGIMVHGILHYDLDETYDKTVENALILFESENGTVETTSNGYGHYVVYLPVGNYNVSVNASGFNLFSNETFVNVTLIHTNETVDNVTVNKTTTKNEMEYNISLDPVDINVSIVISSALQLNLTNVTVFLSASDDVGINNTVMLNLTLNETANQTYPITLNPGNYNVTIEHNATENGTDVSYYNYTVLSIGVGEENITLNIMIEKKIKINGTVWIDKNGDGELDIVNETNHVVINEICYNTSDPKAAWFELYNPTNSSVNITGWGVWFYSIDGWFTIPSAVMEPNEHIIICWNESNFTSYWNVSNETKIIELGDEWGEVMKDEGIDIRNNTEIVDSIYGWGDPYAQGIIPSTSLNHSWSRYKNAYDSDNFTKDFYDESNPTLGYKNTKSKTEGIENAIIEFIIGNMSYTAISDVNGTYEIYLKSGNYRVFVEYVLENATHNITYDEFGNVTFDNVTYNNITYVYLNLTSFSVGNSTKDIQLVEAINISGFTYYDENVDGMPNNEGISVNITFTSNITNASLTITSNITGSYQLYLPPGNYTVNVNEIVYPNYGNATYIYNESLQISQDLTYNISLERDVVIRVGGTVKYDTIPLSNVTIHFNSFETTTDENGAYETYLIPDEYNVTIAHPGFESFETEYNVSISNYSLDAELIPSKVPVYGVTYYDVNDNNGYDNEDVLITNATISFTGTENITVTSNGCYNTILPIGEYTVYANYITPWNTSYCYFGQIPAVEPIPYQQLDIALIRSAKISGHIYYYNMTGENNTALVNITFIRDKGTAYEASKTIEGNAPYEIYLVPGIYTISASYTTFECNMNITYSYDRTIEVSESMRYDINLTKVRECKPGLYWNETEMQTINQGESVSYNITVTNNGNENDTFVLSTLKVTNNGKPVEGWNVSFSKSTIALSLNESENITVNINASINALAYNNTITIRATSQNDTSAFNTTDLIIAVNRINDDIDIGCEEQEKWISAGGSVKFILSIENNGNNNENDFISLTVDLLPKGWNASLDNYRPSILGESKATVTLTVTAPSDAEVNDIRKSLIYTNIRVYAILERNNSTVSSEVLKAVISLPDLIIKNTTFSKSHPGVGETITINATVYNVGNVNAFSSNGFEVKFYVDNRLVNTTYINQTTIKPDENITVSINWNTTGVESGQRIIKVSVGAYNGTLDELNNNNNYATKSLLVGTIKAWWKLAAVIVGIIAVIGAVILIRKIRRRR